MRIATNGYIAFYNCKRLEVYAKSTLEARSIAAKAFKLNARNEYKIAILLAQDSGEQVTHTARD